MADRFPALDEEPDKSIRTSTSASAAPADFLTRERDALGDDADIFATINDDPLLANIDSSQTPGGSQSSAAVQDDDLLGGDFGGEAARDEQMIDFENSFPTVDSRNEV